VTGTPGVQRRTTRAPALRHGLALQVPRSGVSSGCLELQVSVAKLRMRWLSRNRAFSKLRHGGIEQSRPGVTRSSSADARAWTAQ
jgi:hypothetical protein